MKITDDMVWTAAKSWMQNTGGVRSKMKIALEAALSAKTSADEERIAAAAKIYALKRYEPVSVCSEATMTEHVNGDWVSLEDVLFAVADSRDSKT